MTREIAHRRVVVHGRVQGVYFRATTRARALERGLAGWVRNRPDGTVEAAFEGPPAAVEALVRFCATGPAGAAVTSVEVHEEPPQGLHGFALRG